MAGLSRELRKETVKLCLQIGCRRQKSRVVQEWLDSEFFLRQFEFQLCQYHFDRRYLALPSACYVYLDKLT